MYVKIFFRGWDFTSHDLRHFALNNLRLVGNDRYVIKKASGHKTDSAFRCSNYNCEVSSTGPNGPHCDHNGEVGRAVDILISGADALRLVEVAKKYGMTGIGVKQNGPAGKRFIHLDNLRISYTKLTG